VNYVFFKGTQFKTGMRTFVSWWFWTPAGRTCWLFVDNGLWL